MREHTTHGLSLMSNPKLRSRFFTSQKLQEMRLRGMAIKYAWSFGNKPTMTGRFIPDVLEEKFSIKTIIPDEKYLVTKARLLRFQRTYTGYFFSQQAKDFFLKQMNLLRSKGAEAGLLGYARNYPSYLRKPTYDVSDYSLPPNCACKNGR
ncbi:MAG: hypothetical protein U5J63_01310 [Fodinibius sp.]|nr:hypothetical protein [Fodinibius sp.]